MLYIIRLYSEYTDEHMCKLINLKTLHIKNFNF